MAGEQGGQLPTQMMAEQKAVQGTQFQDAIDAPDLRNKIRKPPNSNALIGASQS